MRLLLDTHIYLWSVMDDPKLTRVARELIVEADEVYVSSASIWEASIKAGLGKLDAGIDLLVSEIEASGYRELPLRARHAALVRNLHCAQWSSGRQLRVYQCRVSVFVVRITCE